MLALFPWGLGQNCVRLLTTMKSSGILKTEVMHWYDSLTPLSFLERITYVMPDKTAVINGDRRWTWKEFFDRVNQLSNALRGIGVNKGSLSYSVINKNFTM